MKRKKHKSLIFDFKNIRMGCKLDSSVFDETDRKRVTELLKYALREFSIDKTYVDFDGGKYEKTFMSEDGWDTLCEIATKKKKSSYDEFALDEAYRLMSECYIEQLFEDLGWPVSGMFFETDPDSVPDVTIRPDTVEEWKTYPGKWQTW